MKYGTTAPLAIDYIPKVYYTCNVGGTLQLPETIDVIYNDRSANKKVSVKWDEEKISSIDTQDAGTYDITGKLEDDTSVTCGVEVKMLNYVVNPGFEASDTSMWKVSYEGDKNPTDFQTKADDAHSGEVSFHFWSEKDIDFSIEQELTDLEPGTYQLIVYAQGGDMSDAASMELYAVAGGEEMTESFMVTGWADWKNPTISNIKISDSNLRFGVRMKCNAKSWGTVDDFTLNKISD